MTTTINLVLEGGGVKGIGLVGALARIEQEPVQFGGIAGTSAGSMVAALCAAGYKAEELKTLLMEKDFETLLDPGRVAAWQLWTKYGIHRGHKFYEWIYKLLREKGIVRFEDLKNCDLKIIASDISNRSIVVFDKHDSPKLNVAEAVRMSIGIPFFFQAYPFGQSLFVDGGLLSNYPLWVFGHSKDPTLGVKLVSKGSTAVPTKPASFPQFLTSLIDTMLEAHDKEDEKAFGWIETIHVPTHGIGTTDFAVNATSKQLLFQSGFIAADTYIRNNHGLASVKSSQGVGVAESLDRFRKLPNDLRDKSFVPTHITRRVTIDQPHAFLEVVENLTNTSDRPLSQIVRAITTDTPTETGKLETKAWVTIDGVEKEAAVGIAVASPDQRTFKVRIGFKAQIVDTNKAVQVRWQCKFPSVVTLNEDYWVFPLNFYEKLPERLTLEASFPKIPADLQLFAVSDDGLRPLSLSGPVPDTLGGNAHFQYAATMDSPKEFYLLRWRGE